MTVPRETAVAEFDARGREPVAVPRGLIATPFDPRLRALSIADKWTWWAGYASPAVLNSVESEYFAIRNQATLFDISPMYKYRLSGADAVRVVNRLVTRDVTRIRPGRVGYVVWCDEDGMVIDDGTLFRLNQDEFRICCQESQYSWLHEAAWGFDVEISDESERIAALALQGPTSFSVLDAAGLGACAKLRPYDLAKIEPGLEISRTGFTGDLGYELWVDPDRALSLWDRLWAAGGNYGLRAIGSEALSVARIEAGFIATGVDYKSIHHVIRPSRGRTPFELGLGRLVDFNKGHFNGRRALLRARKSGNRFTLVALDVDGAKPASGALIYYRKKKIAGHVTSAAWSPTTKRNLAFGELKAPYGVTRNNRLSVEIYLNKEGKWERLKTRVRIVERPFFKNSRSRATPPRPH
jgi:aminomethyltransferase